MVAFKERDDEVISATSKWMCAGKFVKDPGGNI
jgi:hypothetical protein